MTQQDTRDEVARRIRAARGYAGLSRARLAKRIATRMSDSGFSAGTLKLWEDGGTVGPVPPHKRNVVAAACGLPPAFFTADFNRLHEITGPPDLARAFEQELREATEQDEQRDDDTEEDERDRREEGQ